MQAQSVMGIAYNSIQKQSCVHSFCCSHLDEVLTPFTGSPILETRLLAKFTMGYLLSVLTFDQRKYLILKPDEIAYMLHTTKSAAQSESYDADGYSLSELLHSLINSTNIQENIPLLLSASVMDVLEACLSVTDIKTQEASLYLSWTLMLCSTSKHLFSCSTFIYRVITSMVPDKKLHDLHKAVLFSLHHERDEGEG